VQNKVANLAIDDTVPADTYGVAYRRQEVRQRSDLFVGENERFGPALPNGAEFHQVLTIACRVLTYRHVLCLVFIDEKHAAQKESLGIEGRNEWPVGTDIGCGQLLHLPLLDLT